MRRRTFTPRPHWRAQCEELGFTFHSIDGTYWDESVAYEFSLEQIETLEAASEDLHQRCLEAVDWVIRHQHFAPFALPAHAVELIVDSWQKQEPSLYGRFDFSWDGTGAPKLLEYNAFSRQGINVKIIEFSQTQTECDIQATNQPSPMSNELIL